MFRLEKVAVPSTVSLKIVEIKVPLVFEYKSKVMLIGECSYSVLIKLLSVTLTKTLKVSKTVIG